MMIESFTGVGRGSNLRLVEIERRHETAALWVRLKPSRYKEETVGNKTDSFLTDSAGAIMGRYDQRYHDAVWCMGETAK